MRFVKFWTVILLSCGCGAVSAPAQDGEGATPAAEATPAADSDSDEDSEDPAGADRETEMLKDIPLGETFQGLRIPHMGPDGNLIMMLDSVTATRIDDRHIAMDGLKIEIQDDDGETFFVEMEKSVFDLDTRVLESDTPVQIRRDDFVIDGDAAEFDTRSRFGRIKGNVKMTIFNTENIE